MPTANFLNSKKNRLIVIACAVIIIVLVGILTVILLKKHQATSSNTSETSKTESSDSEPASSDEYNPETETGEVPGAEAEPAGESIPIEDAISAAQTRANSASPEESFEAKLELIRYYRVLEDIASAEAVINSIDTKSLTDRQIYYFAETAWYLYNDNEAYFDKRDEYLAMKTDASNRLFEQQNPGYGND